MLDLKYYKRLITSEYRRSANFTVMVERLLSYGLDLDRSASDMITAFEVDYATTAQLDILGVIVGVSRQLSFEPSAATGDIVCPAPTEIASGTEYPIINTPEPQNMASVSFISGFLRGK